MVGIFLMVVLVMNQTLQQCGSKHSDINNGGLKIALKTSWERLHEHVCQASRGLVSKTKCKQKLCEDMT